MTSIIGNDKQKAQVIVIGLGRFGTSVIETLDALGVEVLGVETDPRIVQNYAGVIPVIEADMTNPEALQQVGISDFSTAIVAVASDMEASLLIASNLVEAGVETVWAKAQTNAHARILEKIGAHRVVNPELDAGNRVAHLVSDRLLDYIAVSEDFTIVKMNAPRELIGFKLSQSAVRSKYGVTILATKAHGRDLEVATADTRVLAGDIIIAGGEPDLIERFAATGS